jgi:hypothetical protein
VPLKVVAGSASAPARPIQRFNQERRIMIGADLAPGVVEAMSKINQLPSCRTCRRACNARQGEQKCRRS